MRIDGNQVTIGAEIRQEKKEKSGSRLLRRECQYGLASRTFELADSVDESKADARCQDGVLTLPLPKRAQVSQKRIAIA